jgi:hypothetical protein
MRNGIGPAGLGAAQFVTTDIWGIVSGNGADSIASRTAVRPRWRIGGM